MSGLYKQDLPPQGGFQPVAYKRALNFTKGPSGLVMFGALFAIMGSGWYYKLQELTEKKELQNEKIHSRINLVPLLTAEADRDAVRRMIADRRREGIIMGSEDWAKDKEPIYKSGRYVEKTQLLH